MTSDAIAPLQTMKRGDIPAAAAPDPLVVASGYRFIGQGPGAGCLERSLWVIFKARAPAEIALLQIMKNAGWSRAVIARLEDSLQGQP